MKNTNVTGFLLLALLSLTMLGATSPVRGQETSPKLTSKQVRSLIATAKTPEDHQKLAAYYRDKAAEAKANAAEHERILAAYNQNPSTHPAAKAAGGPTEHCRTLIRLFNDEAREDLAMAGEHDQMAKAASQSQ
ncbi:MAG TPA: hypothetical protein VGR97_02245 [Candidatus Acidoferrales bacterium]|nr:hypothetical protein [Candidatus Acidoferrales bacterium]